MPKKNTNDQEHIINAIKNKDFGYVWNKLKWIGYDDEKDINMRYIIFLRAIKDFNYKKNNNFILFYKNYIKYLRFKNNTFVFTDNPLVIRKLKNENASPTDTTKGITKVLKDWSV